MLFCDLTQFYSPVSGGVKRYLREKITWLARRRPGDRHLLIIPGERDERLDDGPSRTYTIRSPLLSRTSRYRALVGLSRVEEILLREEPDLIESGDPYQMAWSGIRCARELGCPVVGFYHSHFPEAYVRSAGKFVGPVGGEAMLAFCRWYLRRLYNRFDTTLVASPALASTLTDWGVGNVRQVNLGVDTEIFRPDDDARAAVRREMGLGPETLLLLYVGRLAAEKNTRTLFRSFSRLAAGRLAAATGRLPHLLVVGDGLQRPELLRLKEETGAISWIPYCGDSARLAALYNAADLFVHPGVQETFGLVAVESQACGTPVVGVRGSYMDRIIHHGQTHWADENSPESLAQSILSIAGRGENLRDLGAGASTEVRARYGWDGIFTRLFALYAEAIARRRA